MPFRILLADDNPVVLRTLRQLLERTGEGAYDISGVHDGRQAVSSALQFSPDLVILDLAMPVVDGLTAARAILKVLPHTPVLLYTMHWSPYLESEAKAAGVLAVIPKSESAALLEAIRQLVDAKPSVAVPDPALASLILPTHRAMPTPIDSPSAAPPDKAASAAKSDLPEPTRLRRSR